MLLKKIKKLGMGIMVGIFTFSTMSTASFAQETDVITLTEQERENFKSIGYTDKDLDNLSQKEYDLYKNINGTLIDDKETYAKVVYTLKDGTHETKSIEELTENDIEHIEIVPGTKEEMMKSLSKDTVIGDDDSPESWIYVRTRAYKSDWYDDQYVFRTDFEWKQSPLVTLTDTIMTNNSSNLIAEGGSEFAKLYTDCYWISNGEIAETKTQNYSSADYSSPEGLGFGFDLDIKDYSTHYSEKNYGYMVYSARTAEDGYTGRGSTGAVYGHKKFTVSPSINWGAPSITPTSKIENTTPTYTEFRIQ